MKPYFDVRVCNVGLNQLYITALPLLVINVITVHMDQRIVMCVPHVHVGVHVGARVCIRPCAYVCVCVRARDRVCV
jgi:hypothetical protein